METIDIVFYFVATLMGVIFFNMEWSGKHKFWYSIIFKMASGFVVCYSFLQIIIFFKT